MPSVDAVVTDRIQTLLLAAKATPSSTGMQLSHDGYSSQERCALLCRWLA